MPGDHLVDRTSDPAEFLHRADPVLAAHRFVANLLTTVAATHAAAPADDPRRADASWWTVRDPHGTVVGAAGRTSTRQLLLSPLSPSAAAALARAVDLGSRHRVHGPPETVAAIAAARPGARVVPVRTEVVRVLDRLRPPAVAGSARPETDDDVPLLVDWLAASAAEMGPAGPGGDRAGAAAAVAQRRSRTGFRLWTVGGRPRSVAGWSRTATIARIGPVYTPPGERRHGFGSAVTAALAAELTAGGVQVMLLADAANATSNHIYADLGFAAVDRVLLADLVDIPEGFPHRGTE